MSFEDYLKRNIGRLMHHPSRLGIKKIFQEAAHNENTHQSLKKQLNELYAQDAEQFKIEFVQCLTIMFVENKKLEGLHTSMKFASTFIVEFDAVSVRRESQGEGLVAPVFRYIFAVHNSSDENLRLRACEFLNQCITNMDDKAYVDSDVYHRIISTMLNRLLDYNYLIRAQAVMVLSRFQKPTNEYCKVVKAFMYRMEKDQSATVRAAVVKNIGFNSAVMPLLFNRITDLDMEVKKAAFKTIGRAEIGKFTLTQIQEILLHGMLNQEVKSYAIDTVLTMWFQQTNCVYVDFLNRLNVETLKEDVTENVLLALFEKEPLAKLKDLVKGWQMSDKLIPFIRLTCENVTVWRFLAHFLCVKGAKEENFDEEIIEILPNLSTFATYIEEYYDSCYAITFIMKQLMETASLFIYSDEMGRKKMKNLSIRFMVTEDELTFYPIIAKIMKKVVPDVSERFLLMAETISDIRNPLYEPVANRQAISSLDSLDLSSQEIPDNEEFKTDSRTLVKCLTIILEFLKLPDVRSVGSTLMTLKNTFIVNCLESTDPLVIELAKNVIALYCVWNKEVAQAEFPNYCLRAQNVNSEPLKTIFDILVVHGLNIYDSPPECATTRRENDSITDFGSDETLENSQVRQLIGRLISLLTHRDTSIKINVVEGLCKLILADRITSPQVLSHITVFWLDPGYEKYVSFRQYLRTFFTTISRKKKGTALMILNSFFPTLEAFHDTAYFNSLVRVNEAEVPKHLLSLIDSDTVAECVDFETLGSYHYRFCMMILPQMKYRMDKFLVLANSLEYISLDLIDGQFANILIEKMDAAIKIQKLQRAAKFMKSFRRNLYDLKDKYDSVIKITVLNESDDSLSEPVPRKKRRQNRRRRRRQNRGKQDEEIDKTKFRKLMSTSSDTEEDEDSTATLSSDSEPNEVEDPIITLSSDSEPNEVEDPIITINDDSEPDSQM